MNGGFFSKISCALFSGGFPFLSLAVSIRFQRKSRATFLLIGFLPLRFVHPRTGTFKFNSTTSYSRARGASAQRAELGARRFAQEPHHNRYRSMRFANSAGEAMAKESGTIKAPTAMSPHMAPE
jgi:hypothetical protein